MNIRQRVAKVVMITFENRVRYEYKIKKARVDTLAKSILSYRDPKGREALDASRFLDVLVAEMDEFYKIHGDLLSRNGNRPHPRSRLPRNKKWERNVEEYLEKRTKR